VPGSPAHFWEEKQTQQTRNKILSHLTYVSTSTEIKYTDLHRTDHGTECFSTRALEGGKKTGKIPEKKKKIDACGTRKHAMRKKRKEKYIKMNN
jgi:hypothetical protein